MSFYRNKPTVIRAVQWTGKNYDECMNFMNKDCGNKLAYEDYEEHCIETGKIVVDLLEGRTSISVNDWIIKDSDGKTRISDSETFIKTYEKIGI